MSRNFERLGLGCVNADFSPKNIIFIRINFVFEIQFVQHNFEGSYANGSDGWSSVNGALEGSSNLEISRLLNWFFADISFHSIHHLCDRIPNYNLRSCHFDNQTLLKNTKNIKLEDIPSCFKYILWDSQLNCLTTIKEAV